MLSIYLLFELTNFARIYFAHPRGNNRKKVNRPYTSSDLSGAI